MDDKRTPNRKGDLMGNFESWMAAVDAVLEEKYCLGSLDIPDQPYSDWFEDGCKPVTAARKAVKNSGEW